MASSKLFVEEEVISVTRATNIRHLTFRQSLRQLTGGLQQGEPVVGVESASYDGL
jgi:hypothetical protein